jgi:hypothetical protein
MSSRLPHGKRAKRSALKAAQRQMPAPGMEAPLPAFRVLAFETQQEPAAAAKPGTTPCTPNYCRSPKERSMKKLVTVTAVTLLCGSAFAQNTGPAPQTGMERPGTTSGAKPDGSMDTTGMSATKGNIKRDKDGAPAPKDEKK